MGLELRNGNPRRPAPHDPATLKADTSRHGRGLWFKGGSGALFKPSYTWGLVRQAQNPVTSVDEVDADGVASRVVTRNNTPFSPRDPDGMASIEGIDLLWQAHQQVMSFLVDSMGHERSSIVLAWGFKTQSADPALDGNVPGSPAYQAINQSGAMNIVSEINDRDAIETHLLAELQDYWGTWSRDQNNYGTEDRWMGEDGSTAVPWACADNDDNPYRGPHLDSIGAILRQFSITQISKPRTI